MYCLAANAGLININHDCCYPSYRLTQKPWPGALFTDVKTSFAYCDNKCSLIDGTVKSAFLIALC